MKIEPFLMERMQSTWENVVRYNLSESGVHPVPLGELVNQEQVKTMLATGLGYSQSNGTEELRSIIAAGYPGATVENILVTTGCSEANFVVTWAMLEPGDELILMLPNYMQIWGLARSHGATVRPLRLREETGWRLDLDELRALISPRTKLIALCNPNNPTGAILDEATMQTICNLASKAGCWILADEVYQGAELDGRTTPSFWGRYERVIITNGLSKAYGLPGIRTGWVVAPADWIARLWAYHDYLTIGPSTLNDFLARIALHPDRRPRILERTRRILQKNFPVLKAWIEAHGEMFSCISPRAGAIAFMKYNLPINSTELVEKILHEKSVLIVPGDHFGMDRYLRIGYGPEPDYLRAGLDLIHEVLLEVSSARAIQRPA